MDIELKRKNITLLSSRREINNNDLITPELIKLLDNKEKIAYFSFNQNDETFVDKFYSLTQKPQIFRNVEQSRNLKQKWTDLRDSGLFVTSNTIFDHLKHRVDKLIKDKSFAIDTIIIDGYQRFTDNPRYTHKRKFAILKKIAQDYNIKILVMVDLAKPFHQDDAKKPILFKHISFFSDVKKYIHRVCRASVNYQDTIELMKVPKLSTSDEIIADVVELTKKYYKLKDCNAKTLYDSYRALSNLVDDVKLVYSHYLVVDFKSEHLKNSSFGSPQRKWEYFLNKDLMQLKESYRKYILSLNNINFSNLKHFNRLFQKEYLIGEVDYQTLEYKYNTLNVKNDGSFVVSNNKYFDLKTDEDRKVLQDVFIKKHKKLEKLLLKLKKYIIKNITIEDIL